MERDKRKSVNSTKKNYKLARLKKETKLDIQLGIAVVLVVTGLIMLMCGFWVVPVGEIDNSVLVAFGECCTFAGSLMGVDYHYRFKTYKLNKEIDDDEEINE